MFRLIISERSPFARRVRVLLKRLEVQYQEDVIDLFKEPLPDEFFKWNPLGTVPVLVIDEEKSLSDSAAIIDYFHEQKGVWAKDPTLAFEQRKASVLAEGLMGSSVAYFIESHLRKLPQDDWFKEHLIVTDRVLKYFQNLLTTNKAVVISGNQLTQTGWDLAIGLQYLELRIPNFDWKKICPAGIEVIQMASQSRFFQETVPPAPVK